MSPPNKYDDERHTWSLTTTELLGRIESAAKLVLPLDLTHADVSRLAALLWHVGVFKP